MALNKEYQKSIEASKNRDLERLVEFLESEREVPAIVKQRGGKFKFHGEMPEVELGDDQYILDIYEGGLTRDDYGKIIEQPTRLNFRGSILSVGDARAANTQVTVSIIKDVAYIRPWRIPSASGFSKVLMLVDDENPGTWNADYVRFAAPAPKS